MSIGFTLSDTSCTTAGCPFSTAGSSDHNNVTSLLLTIWKFYRETGNAGECTNSPGTLSFAEIKAILDDPSSKASKVYDKESAVQIVTFDSNQWVSYDDHDSFAAKIDYANSHCIGGYDGPLIISSESESD